MRWYTWISVWLRTGSNQADINQFLSHTEYATTVSDTDSYDDYDKDYLPEYTGHKLNSKTAAADGEVVAIPIDNIHIEYIEKNSGEGKIILYFFTK